MEIQSINNDLIASLREATGMSERKRFAFDLRNSTEDNSQRLVMAMEVGTKVSIHRHLETSESLFCIEGKMDVIFYDLRPNDDCGGPIMGTSGTVIENGTVTNIFERY